MLSYQRAGGGQIGFEKFYPLSDEKTPFRAFIAVKLPYQTAATHAIRKGQVRWVATGDAVAQREFTHIIFGVAA